MTYAPRKRAPQSHNEGLSFAQARAFAKQGHRIKRAVWETYLSANSKGDLHFLLLTTYLIRCLGTDYHATDIDRAARDWVVA